MAESNGKKERTLKPAVKTVEGPRLIATVSVPKVYGGEYDAVEIVWDVFQLPQEVLELPEVEEVNARIKDRYGEDINGLLEDGVRLLSYRPAYDKQPKPEEKDLETWHEECQTLADGYKTGQRAPATGGQKAKAKRLDGLAAKLQEKGMTLEEFEAKLTAGELEIG